MSIHMGTNISWAIIIGRKSELPLLPPCCSLHYLLKLTLNYEHSILHLNGFDDHFIGRDGVNGAEGDALHVLFSIRGGALAVKWRQLMITTLLLRLLLLLRWDAALIFHFIGKGRW